MEKNEYIDPQFINIKHEHQNVFFISDLHHGHKNICKPSYDDRPFPNIDVMHD